MDIQKIETGFGSSCAQLRLHEPATGNGATVRTRAARFFLTALLVVSMASVPSLAFANNTAGEVSKESGLGAAAAVSSLIYGPAKILYATGGLIVGAFAWAFTAGDSEVAKKVFTRSLRGNYVVTPQHLLGEERLEFIGRDLETPTTSASAVASADAQSYEPYEDAQTYAAPTYESQTYPTQKAAPTYSAQDAGW